ncbi:alpha/beta-hydrolase [Microthyrium microscopicum]|uniref:Alpha/beta-hydrolase n=1 Tax=Microthyrium microscopicum TaxID=703497 RepID=A0A6A6UQ52_9PEZI|nr:alpha/beta-hydrolase [Microthyrium microscopicum]
MTAKPQPQPTLPPLPLPATISQSYITTPSTGLTIHYLSAGPPTSPTILLLHGYPDLAYSWRHTILPLANAGFHVLAPDQRGFGRTIGADTRPWRQVDVGSFTMTNLARDILAFLNALGLKEVHGIVGHDFGAVVASTLALVRPDVVNRLVLMSHPYKPIPELDEYKNATGTAGQGPDINAELAALEEPRTHYRVYNSSEKGAYDWDHPEQGVEEFLRGYIHVKSATWARNQAAGTLGAYTGAEMAKMPGYYIMPQGSSMPEVVTSLMVGEDPDATKAWLSDEELQVYASEWTRTGFLAALTWYRAKTEAAYADDMALWAGKVLSVPVAVVSGKQDWGNYQEPGALESMEKLPHLKGITLIDGAGHWPQQEKPEEVVKGILDFLSKC